MHPVLLNITLAGHQVTLFSYTFFNLFINPLVFIGIGYYFFRQHGFSRLKTVSLLGAVAGLVIVFARVTHYILYRNNYLESGSAITHFSPSGFVMFGGFIIVIPLIFLYTRLTRTSAGEYFDLLTPGWALGIFFNKIGCFLNGCCFGSPTTLPWGVVYPPDGHPYQYFRILTGSPNGDYSIVTPYLKLLPVQLYESLVGLLGFFLAVMLLRRSLSPGTVCLSFCLVYAAARLGLHYIRVIPPGIQFGSVLPLVYLGCMVLSGALLISIAVRRKTDAH